MALGAVASLPGATVPASTPTLFIQEYRVKGAKTLPSVEVEDAVYPFLGPGRTTADVEKARAALEKAYQDKGYQTVAVQIPEQQVKGGIVYLQVIEGTIGRVRVKNSRYYSQAEIKKQAPSLAEGTVPNFNDISRDLVALNQLPDRQVTPSLNAGKEPGTVDIDLTVKDTLPLHGNLEVNNRYSANTSHLRVNGGISYANLWQSGHTLGFNFQVAPEEPAESKMFSTYYLVRVPEVSWLSLMVQGSRQESDVATGAGANSVGRGTTGGLSALVSLPSGKDFYQSLNAGFEFKHLDQETHQVGTTTVIDKSPVAYWPISVNYSFNLVGKDSVTEFNAGPTFGFRGLGSSVAATDHRRAYADGNFIYFHADLSHTHELPAGFQAYGKVQGQISAQPLLDSEEFSGGGLGTARGYLESAALGDNALFGSVELRTPSLVAAPADKTKPSSEWRFYVFSDAGMLTVNEPLVGQEDRFFLASIGVGTRGRFGEHFNGSIDLGLPLTTQGQTNPGDLLSTFRIWAEF